MTDSTTPVSVNGLSGAVSIAAGGRHTCAVVAGKQAYCWGAGENGQRGDGYSYRNPLPRPVIGLPNPLL